jgi:hypothetical protein
MHGIGQVLDSALKLAAAGMPVFPCRADKTPTTPHGFKNAVTDSAAVRELWRQRPGPLIGVPTDAVSGINLLDLDFPKHPESRTWFDENRHRLPATRIHGTLSSGLHLLFKHDPLVRGSAGKIAPGVDTRGAGGYLIWWPAAGAPVVSDAPLAPWPEWLLVEFQAKPRPSTAPLCLCAGNDGWLRGLVRFVANAPEGQRNSILFWAACRAGEAVRDGRADEDFVTCVLLEAAAHAGLSLREAQLTIRSGVQRE